MRYYFVVSILRRFFEIEGHLQWRHPALGLMASIYPLLKFGAEVEPNTPFWFRGQIEFYNPFTLCGWIWSLYILLQLHSWKDGQHPPLTVMAAEVYFLFNLNQKEIIIYSFKIELIMVDLPWSCPTPAANKNKQFKTTGSNKLDHCSRSHITY